MEGDRGLSKQKAVGDWSAAGDFLGAILAGLLLGGVGDHFLGTGPLLTVIGIVAGSSVGFWRMYQQAERAETEALRERARKRGTGD